MTNSNCRGYVLYQIGEIEKERSADSKEITDLLKSNFLETSSPLEGDVAIWFRDPEDPPGVEILHAGIVSRTHPLLIKSRIGLDGPVYESEEDMVMNYLNWPYSFILKYYKKT